MPHTAPDARSPKEIWDDQHRLAAGLPFTWVIKADSLIAAFEVLVAEESRNIVAGPRVPHLSSVAYMLAGFAIEVLIKALLIQTQTTPPLDAKGRFDLQSHHLGKLAEDAGLRVAEEEGRLLEKLEEFLVWAGRYPIPLTSEPMRPRPLPNGGFAPRTYHVVGEDWPAIRALIHKLKQNLPKIPYA